MMDRIVDDDEIAEMRRERAMLQPAWLKKVKDNDYCVKNFYERLKRAEKLIEEDRIITNNMKEFLVQNGKGYYYYVKLSKKNRKAFCTCPDFHKRCIVVNSKKVILYPCKHILACMIFKNEIREKKKELEQNN